ncbi:MAG: hypothetical protein KatS3mg027_1940 [Bacteroidia bacterium]|nr:MAG: hypothetical protein KatS3mg027_1940 [Bacteroidia bacterium]
MKTQSLFLPLLVLMPVTIITGALLFSLHYFRWANFLFGISIIIHFTCLFIVVKDAFQKELSIWLKLALFLIVLSFPFLGGMLYYFTWYKKKMEN